MSHLDPRSVIIVSVALWLICAMLLLSMRRELPRSIQGIKAWAVGAAAMFAGTALIGQRDSLADLLTSVIGNGVLWFGMASCAIGLRRFTGRIAPIWALTGTGVLYVAAKVWYVLVSPDFSAQLVTNAFFIMLVQFVLLETAQSIRPYTRPAKLMVAACAIGAGIALFRIFAVLVGIDNTTGLFQQTSFQKIFLLSFALTWLLSNIAFVLLVNTRLHTALRHAAAYDPLSGLFNRGAITMALENEMERASRHGDELSIVIIDIDHFKLINDSYGHAAGDGTIVNFAQRANLQLRRSDIFGRYGGEEFLAVLPHTHAEKAAQVAERIRAAIAETVVGGLPYTVSIGVAGFTPGMAVDQLVRAADDALYRAKQAGRNRVELEPSESSFGLAVKAETRAARH